MARPLRVAIVVQAIGHHAAGALVGQASRQSILVRRYHSASCAGWPRPSEHSLRATRWTRSSTSGRALLGECGSDVPSPTCDCYDATWGLRDVAWACREGLAGSVAATDLVAVLRPRSIGSCSSLLPPGVVVVGVGNVAVGVTRVLAKTVAGTDHDMPEYVFDTPGEVADPKHPILGEAPRRRSPELRDWQLAVQTSSLTRGPTGCGQRQRRQRTRRWPATSGVRGGRGVRPRASPPCAPALLRQAACTGRRRVQSTVERA
jgi:hypothetical protein